MSHPAGYPATTSDPAPGGDGVPAAAGAPAAGAAAPYGAAPVPIPERLPNGDIRVGDKVFTPQWHEQWTDCCKDGGPCKFVPSTSTSVRRTDKSRFVSLT